MKKMSINTQIALSMAFAAALVTFVIGAYERRAEATRMNADLLAQADLTVSLISGLMIESIIVQDTPVLETAMQEALTRNTKLLALSIKDDFGDMIAQAKRDHIDAQASIRHFSRNINVEGEPFGVMEVDWSTTEGQTLIDANVRQLRFTIGLTVLVLSAFFLVQTNILAMRPLRNIHARMSAAIAGDPSTNTPLSSYASREFKDLEHSVSVLEATLVERDEREHALELARQVADKASRTKSEFLANMSHEIRTPMNGVIGMAELIRETDLDEDQKLFAETIFNSGTALLTIINDILNFSKIEAGKLQLESEPFDLQAALEDIVTLLSPKARNRSVEITLRYDPLLPTVFIGDVGRLRQVITNIAGNAVKFTLDGHVSIDVSGKKCANGYNLSLRIEDTGIGIPPHKINQIFNEFEQVDSARNRQFEGTGLGLAISTRLVALMGGEISATSRQEIGSTFIIDVTLPVGEQVPSIASGPEMDLSGLQALVVDDLDMNRKIVSERLISWDISSTCATGGSEALTILAQMDQHFDLILLDYQMPQIDGEELARRIRTLGAFKKTPIIILSSIDQSFDAATMAEIGFCHYLVKPIRSDQLRNAIERSLQHFQVALPKRVIPAPNESTGGNLKILIAEDNKTNQLVVKKMLANASLSMCFVENGLEAVQQFSEMAPDIVLMDMSMPQMDGVEATRAIRMLEQEKSLGHCPIIALTANAMREDQDRCFEAGMDDFLTKPIGKGKLLTAIQKWARTSSDGACRSVS